MNANHTPTVNKVYNLIVLDESGSMEAIKGATINGFNELIQSVRHESRTNPEIAQWVSFFSFNGAGIKEHLPLVNASHLAGLTPENYRPDNSTPLYDAIGLAVNTLRKAIADEKNFSVLVTILTDGEENSSKEYSFQAIAALINELKGLGWVFAYIGANHDVEKTAAGLNISNHLKFSADAAGTEEMFSKYKTSRNRYIDKLKSGEDVSQGYFDDEKKPQ